MILNDLLEVVGVVGIATGNPEVAAVTNIISRMIKDERNTEDFLKDLNDDELRELIYCAKETLYKNTRRRENEVK